MNSGVDFEWKLYHQDGRRYFEIVRNASKIGNKFTPEIIYNLACMSIEKLFMAYFIKCRKMPMNHTLVDLVDSIKELAGIPLDLEKKIIDMNDFQEICSIDEYQRKIPTSGDVSSFIETLEEVDSYIQELLL